jgi:hypothetical protein
MFILSERHLRCALAEYVGYFNHTGRLANAHPVHRRELFKAKSAATSLRSRLWVGSITSTIWLHDRFCALRV